MGDIHTNRLLALLKWAITGSTPDNTEPFWGIGDIEWQELLAIATRHGVKFIAYEGMSKLPREYRPSSAINLKWYVNLTQAEMRFKHYCKSVEELSALMSQNGMDMMLMKGLSVAQLYAQPYHREGGDVDIYLFGQKERGDELARSIGSQVQQSIDKNSAFLFKNIWIENHTTFLDVNARLKREADLYVRIEERLHQMLSTSEPSYITVGETQIRTMPVNVAALYQIVHLYRHTCCMDMAIRQLCDWVVFFSHNRQTLDLELLRAQIKEFGLELYVKNIELFCQEKLGYTPFITQPTKSDMVTGDLSIENITLQFRKPFDVKVPGWRVFRFKRKLHRVYCTYLAPISYCEYLIPEMKDYVKGKLKRLCK